MEKEEKLSFFENWGSVSWFIMDALWMFESSFAFILVIPALILNLATFLFCKRNMNTIAINSALNCWLAMNICWMISDLKGLVVLIIWAKTFFVLGMMFLLITFLISGNPEIRFKRFRFFSNRN